MTATRTEGPSSADRSLGWRVGSIAGVPIYLARSWFIIGALIVWSWGPSLQAGTTLGGWGYVLALGFAIALMLSVLAHEIAHAMSARAVGMPAQHIALTLWGGHTQFHNETPTPGRGFVVAAAGPAANLALGVGAWLLVDAFDTASAMARLVGALAWANLFVGGFNLLPGLPLDGGAMLEALIWKITGSRSIGTRIAAYIGLGTAASVLVWALAPLFAGVQPSLVRVVIGGAIAMMLFSAARQSLQQARWRGRAQTLSLRALARPAVGIADHVTIAQAHGQVPAGATLVVIADGVPVGIVDQEALAAAMSAGRWGASMASVAQVIDSGAVLSAGEDGEKLLRAMARRPASPHVLVEAGAVAAVVMPADVIRAMEGA